MVPTVCNGLTPSERELGIFDVVNDISPPALVIDKSSQQNRAYNWLVFFDPAQVCPDEILNVTQRYILSLIYFSTGGDEWAACNGPDADVVNPCGSAGNRTRYLTGANVCQWYLNECDGGVLTNITLGKL